MVRMNNNVLIARDDEAHINESLVFSNINFGIINNEAGLIADGVARLKKIYKEKLLFGSFQSNRVKKIFFDLAWLGYLDADELKGYVIENTDDDLRDIIDAVYLRYCEYILSNHAEVNAKIQRSLMALVSFDLLAGQSLYYMCSCLNKDNKLKNLSLLDSVHELIIEPVCTNEFVWLLKNPVVGSLLYEAFWFNYAHEQLLCVDKKENTILYYFLSDRVLKYKHCNMQFYKHFFISTLSKLMEFDDMALAINTIGNSILDYAIIKLIKSLKHEYSEAIVIKCLYVIEALLNTKLNFRLSVHANDALVIFFNNTTYFQQYVDKYNAVTIDKFFTVMQDICDKFSDQSRGVSQSSLELGLVKLGIFDMKAIVFTESDSVVSPVTMVERESLVARSGVECLA